MSTSSKLLPVHKRFDISFSHGEGVYLFSDGKKYLDFGAGIAVNAFGHCHPRMTDALLSQAKKLWHLPNGYKFDALDNYVEKLTNNTFADHTFFCNSGAESVECAIKIIRHNFFAKGLPHKNRIITFAGAFHGRTMATISAAGNKKNIEGFEPVVPGFDTIEFNNIDAVRKVINNNTAAILIEPIQGEEGIVVSNKNFIKELRKICDDEGLLLAFDEVQCGMGRTGNLFAYEYYDVIPDIITIAKAIAGGFPLGACLVTSQAININTILKIHETNYYGNQLAMSLANVALDMILEKGFLENVRSVGAELKTELQNLQKEFPQVIEEVRGVGLMLGIKINQKIKNTEIIESLITNGLLLVPARNNTIRILPPLIINSRHVLEAKEKLRNSFKTKL